MDIQIFKQKMPPYKFLPHTADIKFQAQGQTLEQVFINSAKALTNIITKQKIKPKIRKKIKVKGRDRESLLYNFLEEFLYLVDSKKFLVGKIDKIKIKKEKEYELEADILGDDVGNYETETHVKAITYNHMFVKQQRINNKPVFIAQVVVDV